MLWFSGRRRWPRRARPERSERRSGDLWSSRSASEFSSFLFYDNVKWVSDGPLCMHQCAHCFFVCVLYGIHDWWSSLTCYSVYKGPRGTTGTCRHKSEFAFCRCFSSSVLSDYSNYLCDWIYSIPFKLYLHHFNIWYFQGDTGDRGAPGEKVWNWSV